MNLDYGKEYITEVKKRIRELKMELASLGAEEEAKDEVEEESVTTTMSDKEALPGI